MRLLTALPRQRTPWQARLLAAVLAVLGPVALAVSVREPVVQRGGDARGSAERVVAIAPPDGSAPDMIDDLEPPRAGASNVAPTPRGRDRAVPGTYVGADSPSSADSSGGGTPAPSTTRVPSARELFGSPVAERPLCLPPCGGTGPLVAGGDGTGTRAAVGTVAPPLTRAQRDSVAQAVVAEAARRGGAHGGTGSSLPPNSVGVSLQVGLPGGGPTRAQRERARALDADVTERLARIRARTDSLADMRRRDSVARAMGAPMRIVPRADTARAQS